MNHVISNGIKSRDLATALSHVIHHVYPWPNLIPYLAGNSPNSRQLLISNALILLFYSRDSPCFPVQEALQQLRAVDDKIIYKLNTTVPTVSFAEQNKARDRCKELYDEVVTSRDCHMRLFNSVLGPLVTGCTQESAGCHTTLY